MALGISPRRYSFRLALVTNTGSSEAIYHAVRIYGSQLEQEPGMGSQVQNIARALIEVNVDLGEDDAS